MLPEVVSLAKTNDVLGVNANLIDPNFIRLLVLNVDRGPEKVGGDFKSFADSFMTRGDARKEAMLYLASYLNVKRDEVIAIGDNYNDISMLKMAGLGVCVGDGIIKEYADYICENGYKDGAVKEVIEKFML